MQRNAMVLGAALVLTACSHGQPIGQAINQNAPGLPTAENFRHLKVGACPWLGSDAAATVIAPGWIATTEQAADAFPQKHYTDPAFDLAFVPINGGDPLPLARAEDGEHVWIYGVGCGGDTRYTEGRVIATDGKQCWGDAIDANARDQVSAFCRQQKEGTAPGFIIQAADAGKGLYGGPVVNDKGQMVGILEGSLTNTVGNLPPDPEHLAFAYNSSDVLASGWPLILASINNNMTAGAGSSAPSSEQSTQ